MQQSVYFLASPVTLLSHNQQDFDVISYCIKSELSSMQRGGGGDGTGKGINRDRFSIYSMQSSASYSSMVHCEVRSAGEKKNTSLCGIEVLW